MAVQLFNAIWRADGLRPLERLILLRIVDRVNSSAFEAQQNTDAFMGVRSLAADCGLSKPTVIKILKVLIGAGYLEVAKGSVGTRARTLRVNLDKLHSGQRALPQHGPASGQRALPQESPCGSPPTLLVVNSGEASGQNWSASGQQALPKPDLEPVEPYVHRRAALACSDDEGSEGEEGPSRAISFKVYAAIATKALNASLREDRTDEVGNVMARFKDLCAHEHLLPYAGDIAQRAVDAAIFAKNKVARQFVEQLHNMRARATRRVSVNARRCSDECAKCGDDSRTHERAGATGGVAMGERT